MNQATNQSLGFICLCVNSPKIKKINPITMKKLLPFLLLTPAVLFVVPGILARAAEPREAVFVQAPDSLTCVTPAGEWDLKSNLIYDATTSLSLGVEYGWGRRWSVDLSGSYNPWAFAEGRKWKHWLVQPELRFWTRQRQQGHFVGVHLLGGVYNLNRMYLPFRAFPTTNEYRFEGWGAGVGLTYGYRWNFNDRWAMEGQLGFGYIYSEYDRFCPVNCGVRQASGAHNYIGPTKIALNLIYRFGARKRRAARAAQADALRRYYMSLARRDTVTVRDTVVVRDTVIVRDTIRPPKPQTEEHNEKLTLHLQYGAGSSKLMPAYENNAVELATLSQLVDRIRRDTSVVIHRIHITGYCSIEGTAMLNNRLSYNRAQGVADYIARRYPSLRDLLLVEGRGEDWDGLLSEVERCPDLESRERVIDIIRNVGIYEGRERMLMELSGGRPYRWMLKEIFPQLRRIECSIDYTIRK